MDAPQLRRGSPIHDKAFDALRGLRVDLARFLPWFSHPRLAVPELTPPRDDTTSWNFDLLDPFVEDFVAAAEGRPVVANFATIPTWMFVTPEPVPVSDDPDEIHWEYEQGTELRDPTCAEVADYFYRLASWYIAGGFTDELGVWHESGHRYRFAYWEVLCEPDVGHRLSPETYTRLYDAVVTRLAPLDPEMKFIGLSLSHVHPQPEYYWHFLDADNHADGVPIDAFSYHFYAQPEIVNPFGANGNAPYEHWRDIFFAQADAFVDQVRHIDAVRRRLAPAAATHINELGTFPPAPMDPTPDFPAEYWVLSGSVQSYLWAKLVELGIDLVGIAEFIDYPGMNPGISLLDWETGEPNARYDALALLLRHFGPGDTLVSTAATAAYGYPDPRVHAQGYASAAGDRKILLINKTATPVPVAMPEGARTFQLEQVGVTAGRQPAAIDDGVAVLDAHATAVISWPKTQAAPGELARQD
ncbi:hypothetical protein [Saccharomonospora sp. CUA-673]|uniref:hypothetical protein n=1 Tax=Saccharomonospora sp. CUA-673 TaxID=1904969 RepID=UPI000B1ED9C5|nr:hypothetical protein [Saccharomonospora sp. CUA-673]